MSTRTRYKEPEQIDTGDNNLAMACAERRRSPTRHGIICTWADTRSIAYTTWYGPHLKLDRASRLCQRFYNDVRQPLI